MGGSGWRALRDRANPDMMAGDSLLVQTSPVALPGVLLMDRKPPVVDQNQGPEGKEGCGKRRKKGAGGGGGVPTTKVRSRAPRPSLSPHAGHRLLHPLGFLVLAGGSGGRGVLCVCVCVRERELAARANHLELGREGGRS